MKKNFFISILLAIVSFFVLFSTEVFAYTQFYTQEQKVQKGETIILCDYSTDMNSDAVRIYYDFGYTTVFNTDYSMYYIFYKTKAGSDNWHLITDAGDFNTVFINSDKIHYNYQKLRFQVEDEYDFVCPEYSRLDTGKGIWNAFNSDEICLGKNKDCGKKFERELLTQANTGNTFFEEILEYTNTTACDSVTLEEFMNSEDLGALIKEKVRSYFDKKYKFDTTYPIPAFYLSYINNLNLHFDEAKLDAAKERMRTEADEKKANGEISEEEYNKIIEKSNKDNKTLFGTSDNIMNEIIVSGDDCESLLGDLTPVVENLLKTIQYAGPVLVALLTIVDFVKAALSDESDAMKKASQKLIKRLIAAVLLFFIPLLVNLIFELIKITSPSECINI